MRLRPRHSGPTSARNVQNARGGGEAERTIAHLPKSTHKGLQQQARRGRERAGKAGHALEDRNRQQLYELAKSKNICGRSKMGKLKLIRVLGGSR